jgi:hypothetical protein
MSMSEGFQRVCLPSNTTATGEIEPLDREIIVWFGILAPEDVNGILLVSYTKCEPVENVWVVL